MKLWPTQYVQRSTAFNLNGRLGSIGHLIFGNVFNAGVMLLSIVIVARSLGPAEYGIMVMVLAFGRTVERIFRFESWQPLIKFSTELEDSATGDEMGRLFAYGLAIDIAAATTAAVVAVAAAVLIGPLLGITGQQIEYVAVYTIAIWLNCTGMPTAALRLAGRFRTIAYSQILPSFIRIFLALIGWYLEAGLIWFIAAWAAASISGSAFVFWLGLKALKDSEITSPLKTDFRSLPGSFPGFLSFAWSTNLSMTLKTLTTEVDVLLVGGLAGAPAAGFYNIAKRIAKIAQQVGAHVQTVIYPDVARMWAKGQFSAFRSTTLRVQIALAVVGLALLGTAWLLGEWAIDLAFGATFQSSYALLVAQLVAVLFVMHAAPSRSAMLAMNRPQMLLIIVALGTVLFFATAFFLIPSMGALGASVAHIVLAVSIAVVLDVAWLRTLHRKNTKTPEQNF